MADEQAAGETQTKPPRKPSTSGIPPVHAKSAPPSAAQTRSQPPQAQQSPAAPDQPPTEPPAAEQPRPLTPEDRLAKRKKSQPQEVPLPQSLADNLQTPAAVKLSQLLAGLGSLTPPSIAIKHAASKTGSSAQALAIKQAISDLPQRAGLPVEEEILQRYIQIQAAEHQYHQPAASQELHSQAARLVTFLRTQPPTEQLRHLRLLAVSDVVLHQLTVLLYANVLQLLAIPVEPAPAPEPLPGKSVGVGGDWDPLAPQVSQMLVLLREHPQATVADLMAAGPFGETTRPILQRAVDGGYAVRDFQGGTGVYTISQLGLQRLERER